ncbi:unnamed protein product [Lampetra fluviatilis]
MDARGAATPRSSGDSDEVERPCGDGAELVPESLHSPNSASQFAGFPSGCGERRCRADESAWNPCSVCVPSLRGVRGVRGVRGAAGTVASAAAHVAENGGSAGTVRCAGRGAGTVRCRWARRRSVRHRYNTNASARRPGCRVSPPPGEAVKRRTVVGRSRAPPPTASPGPTGETGARKRGDLKSPLAIAAFAVKLLRFPLKRGEKRAAFKASSRDTALDRLRQH